MLTYVNTLGQKSHFVASSENCVYHIASVITGKLNV